MTTTNETSIVDESRLNEDYETTKLSLVRESSGFMSPRYNGGWDASSLPEQADVDPVLADGINQEEHSTPIADISRLEDVTDPQISYPHMSQLEVDSDHSEADAVTTSNSQDNAHDNDARGADTDDDIQPMIYADEDDWETQKDSSKNVDETAVPETEPDTSISTNTDHLLTEAPHLASASIDSSMANTVPATQPSLLPIRPSASDPQAHEKQRSEFPTSNYSTGLDGAVDTSDEPPSLSDMMQIPSTAPSRLQNINGRKPESRMKNVSPPPLQKVPNGATAKVPISVQKEIKPDPGARSSMKDSFLRSSQKFKAVKARNSRLSKDAQRAEAALYQDSSSPFNSDNELGEVKQSQSQTLRMSQVPTGSTRSGTRSLSANSQPPPGSQVVDLTLSSDPVESAREWISADKQASECKEDCQSETERK